MYYSMRLDELNIFWEYIDNIIMLIFNKIYYLKNLQSYAATK